MKPIFSETEPICCKNQVDLIKMKQQIKLQLFNSAPIESTIAKNS